MHSDEIGRAREHVTPISGEFEGGTVSNIGAISIGGEMKYRWLKSVPHTSGPLF